MIKKLVIVLVVMIVLNIFLVPACFAKRKIRIVRQVETIKANYISWEGRIIKFYCYARGDIKEVRKGIYSTVLYDKKLSWIYSEFDKKNRFWIRKITHREKVLQKGDFRRGPWEVYAKVIRTKLQNEYGAVTYEPGLIIKKTSGIKWVLDYIEKKP